MKKRTRDDRHVENPVEHYIELQLRDLRGERLDRDESRFLAAVALAAYLLPGALEEELLKTALARPRRW